MRVTAKAPLRDFWTSHADAKDLLKACLSDAENMNAEAIKSIETEEDYKSALSQFDLLSDAEEGTAELDRLDVLVTLIEAYEAKHYPIGPPSLEAAVDYEMEKRGSVPAIRKQVEV